MSGANYSIGNCKPPKHTQFKKGVSGNPRGRPKGSLNMATVLQNTLNETVEVIENGRTKTISKMEAAVRRLVDEAIQGDMHAFRVLSVLTQLLQVQAGSPSSAELEAADQKVLQTLIRQFSPARNGQS